MRQVIINYQNLADQLMAILPSYDAAGLVLSIVSLSFVVPVLFIFRHYFRGLDFLQMTYFFSIAMGTTSFASKLGTSVVNFNYNFFSFCTKSDFVCSQGFQLSFGAVLAGVIIFFFLVVVFQKCCKPDIRFQPVYLSFKGFIKWIYISLVVFSTQYLMTAIISDISNIIAPAVVLGVLALLPVFQLIGYKCIQEENDYIWRKWIEFFNYLRALSVSVLLGISLYYKDRDYCHYIMIPLILYAFIYVWKGEFKYPVMERILCGLGEGSFLALFYLYKYGQSYITDYDLDFFLVAFVILIDVILYLVRGARLGIYGVNEGAAEVNPEDHTHQQLETKSPIVNESAKKVNKYDPESDDLQKSNQSLNVKVNKNALLAKNRK